MRTKYLLVILLFVPLLLFTQSQETGKSTEERIISLESTISELKNEIYNLQKNINEKDEIIDLMKEQHNQLVNVAKVANDSLNRNITIITWWISIFTVVMAIFGVLLPLYRANIQKKAIKELEEKNVKLSDEISKVAKKTDEAQKSALEANSSAKDAKIFSLFSEAYNSEKLDDQFSLYNKIIELNPNNSLAYNNRGNVLLSNKEYNKAISEYNKAIELDPRNPKFYNNRGIAYKKIEDYDKAIRDYEKAIELEPSFLDPYNNLSDLYRITDEYNKAIKLSNKAIKIDPNDPEAYGELAEIYASINDDKKFYKYLEKALEKGYPLMEAIKDEEIKKLYDKYKGKKAFNELIKRHGIYYSV